MIMDELAEHEVVYSAIKSSGKQTNADKIRSMADEELAEFIQDIWCDNHGVFVDKLLSKSANPIYILEMLKSEVENEMQ